MLFETIAIALISGSVLLNIHFILKSTCHLCGDFSLDVDFKEEKKNH